MENNETMVQDLGEEMEMDDLSIDEVVEEPEEEPSESLDSIMGEIEEPEEEQPDEQPEEPPKAKGEPGYVRGRIEKAVARERASMQADFDRQIAEMKSQFEAQMAPFRARMIEDEAQELVRSRKISDIETAREFVRMKNGQPAAAPAASTPEPKREQPRQSNGQFAPREDPAISARVSMLNHQAEQIEAETGLDVTAEFMSNPEIKKKVISGEMDFYDVAKQMQKPQKKRPPSPMRSPNGASGNNPNAFENMTSEQFAKLEKKIQEGARYTLT